MHDIISLEHAHKAIAKGADGLIAVAAGAGGHAGTLSPFALIEEIRAWFEGPLALSGAIATPEANASGSYKEAIVAGSADDIVTTNYFTGINGNYLRGPILAAGLDPKTLSDLAPLKLSLGDEGAGSADDPKPWRDIWGAGQGIGAVKSIASVETLVARLNAEYREALGILSRPVAAATPP